MASQGDANWKFNACKKIAQLTKVVFRLHTESLDRKDFVAHIKKKGDQEIEAIVQRSNEAIQEAQRDASEYRDTLQQILRDEYQAKFEHQLREYEVLKTKLDSEAKQIADRSALQLASLRKDLEALRAGGERSRAAFEDAARELARANQAVLDAMGQRHERELARCIAAGNERYNGLVVAHAGREDEIRRELQQEMVELRRAATADSLTQSEALKRRAFDLENKVRGLESAAKRSGCTIANLRGEVDRLERDNAALREMADAQQAELQDRRRREVEDLAAKFGAELAARDAEIAALAARAAAARRDGELLIEERTAEWQETEKSYQSQIRELQRRVSSYDGITQAKLDQLLAEHRARLADWEAKYNEFAGDTQRKEKLMHDEMVRIQQQSQDDIDALKRQQELQLRQKTVEMNKLKFSCSQEMQKAKEDFDRQMQELRNEIERKEQQRQALLAAMELADAASKETFERMRSEYELRLQDMQQKKDLEVQTVNLNCEERLQAIRKRNREEMTALEEQHRAEVKTLQESVDVELARINERGELELKMLIEKTLRELEKEAAVKFGRMRDVLDKELEDSKAQYSAAINELQESRELRARDIMQSNAKIADLESQLIAAQAGFGEQRLLLISQHEQALVELHSIIANQNSDHKEELRAMQEKTKQMIADFEQKLASASAQHALERSQLSEMHAQEIAALKAEIDRLSVEIARLTALSEQTSKEFADRLAASVRQHSKMLDEMRGSHEQQIDALSRGHEEEMRRFREENTRLNDYLKDAHESNIRLRADLVSVTTSSERHILAQIAELERQKTSELNLQKEAYEARIAELMAQLDQLTKQRDGERTDHELAIEAREKAFSEEKARVREKHRAKAAQRNAAWRQMVDERDVKVKELLEEIEAWKIKYETRDARPQDLALIRQLEAIVAEKTDTLSKLLLELRHYQNEMLNREAAYNKTFSMRPSVGVLNVLERKVKVDIMATDLGVRSLPPLTEGLDSSIELLPEAKKKRKLELKPVRSATPRKI
jgi:serologically defined colon cancer antigen 8